eukprot:TRINITY_DN25012_c0_g1_i1.p1 TRINITY_DN25012_c0_g1~~TRINITY_DN25012_c0_g1_i1.p1  ORF type:complete len:726 (-),score=277.49 TRINITY_DN25012_c0_g1_i1:173-2350(-)
MHHPGNATADTDDEDGTDGDSSSGGSPSNGAKLLLGGAGEAASNGLSQEEFVRLQDELMALKIHNQDLLDEQRWLQNAATTQGSSGQSMAETAQKQLQANAATAAAVGASLRASFSAVGARGIASVQSTLNAANDTAKARELQAAGTTGSPTGTMGTQAEREALRAEAETLRSTLREKIEEVEMLRDVAKNARQAAANMAAGAAVEAGPSGPRQRPPAADLRQKVTVLLKRRSSIGSSKKAVEASRLDQLDDRVLGEVADAVLQLDDERAAAKLAEEEAAEDEEDEDRKLLKQKILAQQQEVDRLMGVFNEQQQEIIRLRDQIPGSHTVEETKKGEERRLLKEKVKETEKSVEALLKQVESSEEVSKQSQEMKASLKSCLEQAKDREAILDDMEIAAEKQSEETRQLCEWLRQTQEDISGQQRRRMEVRRTLSTDSARSAGTHSLQRATSSSCPTPNAGQSAASGGGAADAAKPMQASSQRSSSSVRSMDIGIQAEILPGLAAIEERRRLLGDIDDARIEKTVLERRAARELRDLKALAAFEKEKRRKAEAEKSAVEYHDIGSDGQDSPGRVHTDDEGDDADKDDTTPRYPAELVWLQALSELEQGNDTLMEELETLHDRERMLRDEIKEKNQLIAHLTRKSQLFDSDVEGPKLEQSSGGLLKMLRWQDNKEKRQEELERFIEATTDDNIRLRNDVQLMANELRKALEAVGEGGVSSKPLRKRPP